MGSQPHFNGFVPQLEPTTPTNSQPSTMAPPTLLTAPFYPPGFPPPYSVDTPPYNGSQGQVNSQAPITHQHAAPNPPSEFSTSTTTDSLFQHGSMGQSNVQTFNMSPPLPSTIPAYSPGLYNPYANGFESCQGSEVQSNGQSSTMPPAMAYTTPQYPPGLPVPHLNGHMTQQVPIEPPPGQSPSLHPPPAPTTTFPPGLHLARDPKMLFSAGQILWGSMGGIIDRAMKFDLDAVTVPEARNIPRTPAMNDEERQFLFDQFANIKNEEAREARGFLGLDQPAVDMGHVPRNMDRYEGPSENWIMRPDELEAEMTAFLEEDFEELRVPGPRPSEQTSPAAVQALSKANLATQSNGQFQLGVGYLGVLDGQETHPDAPFFMDEDNFQQRVGMTRDHLDQTWSSYQRSAEPINTTTASGAALPLALGLEQQQSQIGSLAGEGDNAIAPENLNGEQWVLPENWEALSEEEIPLQETPFLPTASPGVTVGAPEPVTGPSLPPPRRNPSPYVPSQVHERLGLGPHGAPRDQTGHDPPALVPGDAIGAQSPRLLDSPEAPLEGVSGTGECHDSGARSDATQEDPAPAVVSPRSREVGDGSLLEVLGTTGVEYPRYPTPPPRDTPYEFPAWLPPAAFEELPSLDAPVPSSHTLPPPASISPPLLGRAQGNLPRGPITPDNSPQIHGLKVEGPRRVAPEGPKNPATSRKTFPKGRALGVENESAAQSPAKPPALLVVNRAPARKTEPVQSHLLNDTLQQLPVSAASAAAPRAPSDPVSVPSLGQASTVKSLARLPREVPHHPPPQPQHLSSDHWRVSAGPAGFEDGQRPPYGQPGHEAPGPE
ncbi:MAG: heme binding [Chaenotheca gracillima]|nr:MAG: heme binding [Chaenotheca gracillima]